MSQSDLYQSLPLAVTQIRVVHLPPKSSEDTKPLQCSLEVVDPSHCEYEALSYCWGDMKKRTYISLNSQTFQVSTDLEYALETLCLPDQSRTIWVDWICMNQSDVEEKNIHVARMREVYTLAKRTVVWLGDAQDNIDTAFEHVSQLFTVNPDQEKMGLIWSQMEESLAKCLNEIIQRPYWSRSWTVQEVVLSPDSILYCGASTIPFFELAIVLIHPETKKHLKVTYSIYSYLKAAMDMRSADWHDPELGLFGLAYIFRHRKLTNRLDRVYAFRGLIKSEDTHLKGNAAAVDYKQREEDLWHNLCKETMFRYQTLLPLVLAEKSDLVTSDNGDWCMDFSKNFPEPNSWDEHFMLFWSGGLDDPLYYPLQATQFSAAGGCQARVKVDVGLPSVISAEGFTCDEVVAVGNIVSSWMVGWGRPNYVQLFQHWETVVGGPWPTSGDNRETESSSDSLAKHEIFALTVTGGAWTQEPLDWRHWNTHNYSQRVWDWRYMSGPFWTAVDTEAKAGYDDTRHFEKGDEAPEYDRLRDDACEGRRMVLLKSGRFGLVPESTTVGDKVVVLLGCDVPMVLHRQDYDGWWGKIVDYEKREMFGYTWKRRGQAYVHELMRYDGDIEKDIESGKVKLETFLFA
ncbi:heterokaryon incompatibility protein-domain-containing protein [Xylariaceae sp. FL0255]|nr:heterokaryon incompatibility protein-domain-containing protein [Xylariaceae sp. FL0255]